MTTENKEYAELIRHNGLSWASQKLKRTQLKGDILQKIIDPGTNYNHPDVVQSMKLSLNRKDFAEYELKGEFQAKFPDLHYEGFYLFPMELAVLINYKKIVNLEVQCNV